VLSRATQSSLGRLVLLVSAVAIVAPAAPPQVLRAPGAETPTIAELFLPSNVERLPADRRLLPFSSLQAVSGALALTVFNPERAAELEGAREAGEKRQERLNGRSG
jgi:hypothetical protein